MKEQKIDTGVRRTVKSLQKHFENRVGSAWIDTNDPENPEPVEDIIGKAYISFANFWERHAEDLEILVAVELQNYSATREYTPEIYAAFKEGIGKIGFFFTRCAKAIEDDKGSSEPSQHLDSNDTSSEDSSDPEVAGPDESLDSAH